MSCAPRTYVHKILRGANRSYHSDKLLITWRCGGAVAAGQRAGCRLGFLHSGSRAAGPRSFRVGVSDEGFVEGRDVVIERRYAEGQYDRLVELATELVRVPVAVISAAGVLTRPSRSRPPPRHARGPVRLRELTG